MTLPKHIRVLHSSLPEVTCSRGRHPNGFQMDRDLSYHWSLRNCTACQCLLDIDVSKYLANRMQSIQVGLSTKNLSDWTSNVFMGGHLLFLCLAQGLSNQMQLEVTSTEGPADARDLQSGRAFQRMARSDADSLAAALEAGMTAALAGADHLRDTLDFQVCLLTLPLLMICTSG